MQSVSTYDMVIVLNELKKIKKPSKRIQAAIQKLEDRLCELVEGMFTITPPFKT